MPTYEYECKKCHHRFDLRRRFGEDGTAKCPKCNNESIRVFTAVPVIFKGSGFYVTDHRGTNPASSDESKATPVDSKTTPDGKKIKSIEPVISPKKD
jgi:putative FmdB family regulatory protein